MYNMKVDNKTRSNSKSFFDKTIEEFLKSSTPAKKAPTI